MTRLMVDAKGVAVVTSKRKNERRTMAMQWMTAACVAAAMCVGGCDSKASEASRKAQQNADEAARLMASAGEMRPSKKFIDDAKGKEAADIAKMGDAAAARIKTDSDNSKGAWKEFLEQRTVADDLATGASKLNEALKDGDLSDPSVKAALQTQLGATASQQAGVKMHEAQAKLSTLLQELIDLQTTSEYLGGMGMEAGILEKRAQLTAPGEAAVKSQIAEAKATVSQKQQAVDAIEKQISEKRTRAAQVYAETDAALQAADRVAGREAIEQAKKAVEARKEGDNLTAEVVNLQPQLSQAKLDLEISKIALAQAEGSEAAMTAGIERGKTAESSARAEATRLRGAADTAINEAKGFEAKYKEFTALAAAVQKDADAAVNFARDAENNYKNAINQLNEYQKKVGELKMDPADPLLKVAKAPETKQLMLLGEAEAALESGRAYLVQYLAERYKTLAATARSSANAAAGKNAETAPAGAEADLKGKAVAAFDRAAGLAKQVTDTAKDSQKFDANENGARKSYATGPTIQWLGYTLNAVANHGKYIVTEDDKALKLAKAAAEAAQRLNPTLPLGIIAEGAKP